MSSRREALKVELAAAMADAKALLDDCATPTGKAAAHGDLWFSKKEASPAAKDWVTSKAIGTSNGGAWHIGATGDAAAAATGTIGGGGGAGTLFFRPAPRAKASGTVDDIKAHHAVDPTARVLFDKVTGKVLARRRSTIDMLLPSTPKSKPRGSRRPSAPRLNLPGGRAAAAADASAAVAAPPPRRKSMFLEGGVAHLTAVATAAAAKAVSFEHLRTGPPSRRRRPSLGVRLRSSISAAMGDAVRDPMHPKARKSFFKALKNDSQKLVGKFLENATLPSGYRDDHGRTPLVVACCEGHTALLDMLLDAGVDIDQTDSKGWTPLHHCASLGYHGLACRLVERGASVCPVTSGDNATPLHLASMNGHANIVELMLGGDRPSERQASADEVDFAGMTPLHMASWRGHAPVVRVLLSAGANRDLKDKEGLTADTWASDGKHQEVQAILGSGYNKLRKARVKLKAAIAMKRGSLVKAIKVRCG
jgi:hypothetical protein